mmetsp:Transcript_20599/g.49035  ORF Transcript_20599/g.49035 Transcript_20599/m.49035 type:complete len:393 (-) Transcript_20599:326-1504(-)
MLLLLDVWPKIRAHLPNGLAGRPSNSGMRVLHALHAHIHQAPDLLQHDLGTALRNLREADEGAVAVPPVLVVEEAVHHGSPLRRVEDRCPAQSDRHPVQALLTKLAQLPLPLRPLLVLGGVPLRVILNVEQVVHQAHEKPVIELRELPHHAGRLLSRLTQRHNKLARKLPRRLLQLRGLCDGHHRLEDLRQRVPNKLGVDLCNLDERFDGLLCIFLLTALQSGFHDIEHRWDQREELLAVLLILKFLDEDAGSCQGRAADVQAVVCSHARLQDRVHGLQVLHEHWQDERRQLSKHVQRALHHSRVLTLNAVEHEGQKLRPPIRLLVYDVDPEVTHNVTYLSVQGYIFLHGKELQELVLHCCLHVWRNAVPEGWILFRQNPSKKHCTLGTRSG